MLSFILSVHLAVIIYSDDNDILSKNSYKIIRQQKNVEMLRKKCMALYFGRVSREEIRV